MTSHLLAIDFLSKEFCAAFGSVFEQTAGEAYNLKGSDETELVNSSGALGYLLGFTGAISGSAFVQVDLQSAAVLASRLMQDSSESVSYLPEHEDALFEIVSQTAGVISTEFRTRFGTAEITVERKPVPALVTAAIVLEPANGADPVSVRLCADQILLDSINACLAPSPAARNEVQTGPAQNASSDPQSNEHQNLRLIMDVELDLTLRFGQRTLMLSEVADLTTGSVVELDRIVDDPVELLLGDRVIARGEVVIVDGNYGLRITELASIDRNSLLSA
jgi:flagellar motor switch protein FliN/FliY